MGARRGIRYLTTPDITHKLANHCYKGIQMKTYQIVFTGCKKGAIGIHYTISALRSAESPEAALQSLYSDYEHIHMPRITEHKDTK